MGKKSKIFKGGLNKKNYQVVLKAKKLNLLKGGKVLLNEEDDLSSGWESNHDEDNDDMDIEQNENNTNNVNANKSQVKRLPGQLRHRRNVRKSAPTKGQRKRQEKKDKFIRRNLLVEKIKTQGKLLNNTTLTGLNNTTNLNNTTTQNNNIFNLKELNNNLFSFVEEIKKESNKKQKKKRNVCISDNERKKLSNILTNKDYLNNPLSAIKKQIKQSQQNKERNLNIEKELKNLKF